MESVPLDPGVQYSEQATGFCLLFHIQDFSIKIKNAFLVTIVFVIFVVKKCKALCWKQPKFPPVNEWIKKTIGAFTQWNTTQQKERSPILHKGMDGTGEHYAK